MAEEIERWLMFTHWGSYLKEDHIEVGLDVTEILMKHLEACRLEGRKNTGLENMDSFDKIQKEVLNNRDRYRYYKVAFFNPSVTKEIYVNRLVISDAICFLKSMMDSKFIKRRIRNQCMANPGIVGYFYGCGWPSSS